MNGIYDRVMTVTRRGASSSTPALETGCPTLTGAVMSTPVEAGPSGQYEVLWRVVSSDGHPVAGTYTFTVEPGATETDDPGSVAPKCGPQAPATEEATAAAVAPSAPPGVWLGIGIGAAAVVTVTFAALLLIRKPRATGTHE